MNTIMKTGLATVTFLAVLTGCGQSVPGIQSKSSFNECTDINKKLLQTDEFIEKVERTSAFHLDEAAVALQNPRVSTSNNKKDMLKDANRRKAKLLADSQTYGCKPYKK